MPHEAPVVFVFPGQSSRTPGMLSSPDAIRLIDRACEVLGVDLRAHVGFDTHAQPTTSRTNHEVQLGVFLANHLHLQRITEAGLVASCSLGLSLGEYNHLVHIGALSFEDALRLVDARGRIYDEGPRGAMVAVFPLPLVELRPLVERARMAGPLEIAVYASPMQHVVAGTHAAVEMLIQIIEDEHVVEVRVIEPHIPMHCSVFSPAADALRRVLERAPWKTPHRSYLPNVIGKPIDKPTADDFVDQLSRHVHQAVHFQTSIEGILERTPNAVFVEVGPGQVLTNLMRRWINRPVFAMDADGGFDAVMDKLSMRGAHGN